MTKAPRIGIVGVCQVVGLRAALKRLSPESDIAFWHVGVSPGSPEEIVAALAGCDVVVTAFRDDPKLGPLCLGRLKERLPAVTFVPSVVFRGFHPDCIYLQSPTGLLGSELGSLHSAIVVAAYLLGIPAERVPKLFNSLIFSALGYFDSFNFAKAHMLTTFSDAGFDLAPYLEQWVRSSGAFMYTVNHPKIGVLAQLGKLIAKRVGLIDDAPPSLDDLDDALSREAQWPVYPELAARIGIIGSTNFTRALKFKEPGLPRELVLPVFVARHYQRYAAGPLDVLRAAMQPGILQKMEAVLCA